MYTKNNHVKREYIFGSFASGFPITLYDAVASRYRSGRIAGISLESGHGHGTAPKHLLVRLESGVVLYVYIID